MPSIIIVAAGTPQSLARNTVPGQPTVSHQGILDPIGGEMVGQLVVQNPPGSTGNLYIGSPTMVKATLAGVDAVLIPGDRITIGNGRANVVLDQVWVDTDTSGNKVVYLAK